MFPFLPCGVFIGSWSRGDAGECHVFSSITMISLCRSFITSSVSVSGPSHSHRGTLPTPCHYFNQMQLPPLWGQLSFVDCPFSVSLCPCPCRPPPPPTAHYRKHTHMTTVPDQADRTDREGEGLRTFELQSLGGRFYRCRGGRTTCLAGLSGVATVWFWRIRLVVRRWARMGR